VHLKDGVLPNLRYNGGWPVQNVPAGKQDCWITDIWPGEFADCDVAFDDLMYAFDTAFNEIAALVYELPKKE